MFKALFSAITGIDETDIDSDESQDAWERRRFADENDLDDSADHPDDDDQDDEAPKKWWQL